MPDYKTMYHTISNAVTDADRLISQAMINLRKAQQTTESLFVEADDTPIELLPPKDANAKDNK